MIDTPEGGQVKLEDVATVSLKPSPHIITREIFKRRIDVGANATGRGFAAVVADVKKRLAKIRFPLEYSYELLGEYTERQAAERQVLVYPLAAGVGILLLLQVVSPAGAGTLGLLHAAVGARRRCVGRRSAMAMFPSARLSGSLRCSELPRGMSSSSIHDLVQHFSKA